METVPDKYLNNLWLLRGLIHSALNNTVESKKDFEKAYKFDSENAQKYLQAKTNIQLNIFPIQNRLCSQFPFTKITIGNNPAIVNSFCV